MKRLMDVKPREAKEPLLGFWLAYLEDCRNRTKEVISNLKEEQLDEIFPQQGNTIGTLLYHIALIEADWLYAEILHQGYPDFLQEWFPLEHRNEKGELSIIKDWKLQQYVSLLDKVRYQFVQTLSEMTLEDFHRLRSLPDYDVSPEWVCLHLLQHEASHRGQIQALMHFSP